MALAAGRHRRLRPRRRRRAAAHGGLLRAQLQRHPQAVGPGRHAARQPPAAGRGAARDAGPADPQPVHRLPTTRPSPTPTPASCAAALRREDLFTVVHDPFLSVTARYADIVLPAATYLETEDFYRSYGSYYMQYGHRAVAPLRRGALERRAWRRRWRQRHGHGRSGLPHVAGSRWCRSCSAAPPAPSSHVDPTQHAATPARSTSRPRAGSSSAPPRASSSSTPRRWPSRACRRCPTGSPTRRRCATPRAGRCGC